MAYSSQGQFPGCSVVTTKWLSLPESEGPSHGPKKDLQGGHGAHHSILPFLFSTYPEFKTSGLSILMRRVLIPHRHSIPKDPDTSFCGHMCDAYILHGFLPWSSFCPLPWSVASHVKTAAEDLVRVRGFNAGACSGRSVSGTKLESVSWSHRPP